MASENEPSRPIELSSLNTPSSPNAPSSPSEPSSPRPSSTDHEYTIPSEQPRPLVFPIWRGLLLGPVIHFPALALTGAMLWLNHSSEFWFDEGRLSRLNDTSINNILNALQLLAKIYELFVLVSLAHITSQAFKRRLISDGLPAGMLTAGYRVGDIFYLMSPHFWSGRKGAMRLAVFLFINTMLAVLTGPASAILIVPKLGYYRINEPFFPGAMPIFLDSPDLHWPDLLDGAVANTTECSQEAANYNIGCPGAGFGSLYTWASSWETGGLPDHISFSDHAGRVTRRLQLHNRKEDAGVFATTPMSVVGSTVSQLETMIEEQALGKITVYNHKMELATDKTTIPVYQPLANSKCFVWNETEMDATRRTRAGDDGKMGADPFFKCFSENDDDRCHRTSRLLSDRMRNRRIPVRNSNADMSYNLTVGTSEDTLDGLPLTSPLFSARLPYAISGSTTPGQRFVVCGALSHWIPTSVTVDPNNKDVLRTNITDLSIFEENDVGKAVTDRVIQIDETWLKYVDPVLNISTATESDGSVLVSKRSTRLSLLLAPFLSRQDSSNSPLFQPVAGVSGGTPDEHVKSIFENCLAAVLADAISRTHAVIEPGPLMYLRTDENASPEDESGSRNLRKFQSYEHLWERPDGGLDRDWFMKDAEKHERMSPQLREIIKTKRRTNVSLEFDAYRYGYGFGSSSAQPLGTVAFALCVVYAYLVVLMSYLLLVAIRASPAVGAWGDLHDLVTLAWSSTAPTEIANQGSGVRSKGFLSETVTIRAVSKGGPVFMGRSKDQASLLRLEKGKKYL
ncbi:hypothetical protein F5X68DRAFT_258513 [Plectosphaerella plurivora]|uniref:Uncharacterized protein n=1 Tax=Plectosphaerella plurivora TaxID=936078 RepID=A0A9P9ADW0_9PEZI|nr:hypothetical protein F5X68DRAFT_258513 [Plectosphaerella plurivora]